MSAAATEGGHKNPRRTQAHEVHDDEQSNTKTRRHDSTAQLIAVTQQQQHRSTANSALYRHHRPKVHAKYFDCPQTVEIRQFRAAH